MEAERKELLSRKNEIIKELKLLFKANMKITDWDIPEADDKKAAEILLEILKEGLREIEEEIKEGKYNDY